MRAWVGVGIETGALLIILALAPAASGGTIFAVYVILAELLATYLIHCPAHYMTGRVLGIRFTSIRLGRTTLAKILPPSVAGLARRVPILTLAADKGSLAKAAGVRAAAMYASGAVASVFSALLIAAVASLSEPLTYALAAWAVAILYLLFDVVFSPRSGDLARAMAALGAQ